MLLYRLHFALNIYQYSVKYFFSIGLNSCFYFNYRSIIGLYPGFDLAMRLEMR